MIFNNFKRESKLMQKNNFKRESKLMQKSWAIARFVYCICCLVALLKF